MTARSETDMANNSMNHNYTLGYANKELNECHLI